jgi:transposase
MYSISKVRKTNTDRLAMLQLSSTTRYYWYSSAVDMRKGFDALCGMVSEHMQQSVLQGGVFIFCNRRHNQIKLLHWEGDGLAIYYKRLEKGTYELPLLTENGGHCTIAASQLQLILQGIVLSSVQHKRRFAFIKQAV